MIPFTKMHGLGNDFILIERVHLGMLDVFELARRMCARHTGIGADGLLLVSPSDKADLKMRIINSDGSEAEMCGNGIRCFARYAYERGLINKKSFTVETLGGIILPALVTDAAGEVRAVTVDMGVPLFERESIPMAGAKGRALSEALQAGGRTWTISALRMGVPHAVVFVEDVDGIDVEKDGRAIETHAAFPEKTNVDFVQVLDEETIAVRTWERGAGVTLACGTGACASVVAANLLGKTQRKVTVQLELGTLSVSLQDDGRVLMSGPAEYVFEGKYRK
ncbi:MAG: diaminopimelate epimerase [Bacillota bacterium]